MPNVEQINSQDQRPVEREFYTVNEVISMVPVPRSTLYELIRAGHIEAKKIGRRTMIPAASLRSWIGGLPNA
jgi:excisionase family DNA binding protein